MPSEIVYRTNEFDCVKEKKPQSFTKYTHDYQLDKATDELVEVGLVNDQEVIQSYEDCSLNHILDKYVKMGGDSSKLKPIGYDTKAPILDCTQTMNLKSDLDKLSYIYQQAEEFKEKYSLNKDLSPTEVFKQVGEINNIYSKHLKKKVEAKKDVKKKETIEESK